MTIPYKTPLSYIEGIGPRTAQRLATLNLYYVFDLIRASAEQVHPAVSGVASVDEVRRWRSMAILLQVDTMTNHWAEALVWAGVKTIEELSGKSGADLTKLFAAARRKRVAPTVPTAQDTLRMLLDATVIHFTGGLNGTVQDRNGHGIPDVEARIGLTQTTTDERGRFRLIRIPLGVGQQLTLRHLQYRTASIDSPLLSSNDDLIGVSTFVLTPRSSGSGTEATRLSEYEGDVLPQMAAFSITARAMEPAGLRDRDLFILHKIDDDGSEARLASKYLEYEDGKFYVLEYRVPLSRLPPEPKARDTYRYVSGEFRKIKVTPSALRYLRTLRRVRKTFRERPGPQTALERDARIREMGEAVKSL